MPVTGLPGCCPVVPLLISKAPVEVKDESDDAVNVVNAPVVGVVAPTVPLMLIEAVPVKLVTVPLDGVPNAPPLTTNAPAVPTLTPKAVTTPVPVVVCLISLPVVPLNKTIESFVEEAGPTTSPDAPAFDASN